MRTRRTRRLSHIHIQAACKLNIPAIKNLCVSLIFIACETFRGFTQMRLSHISILSSRSCMFTLFIVNHLFSVASVSTVFSIYHFDICYSFLLSSFSFSLLVWIADTSSGYSPNLAFLPKSFQCWLNDFDLDLVFCKHWNFPS